MLLLPHPFFYMNLEGDIMDKVYIGKIVSTHGLKGEVKIISDFPFKDKAFAINNILIIDNQKYKIRTYRHHKIYDMVTLGEYNSINDVEFLLKKKVYINKTDLLLSDDEILDSDLLEFKVIINNNILGQIFEIFKASPTNKVLRIKYNDKIGLIPLNNVNIKIDKKNKTVYINEEDMVIL